MPKINAKILPIPLLTKNKCYIFLKCVRIWLQIYKLVCEVKVKANAFQHFKDNPVLKFDATFHSSVDQCDLDSLYYRFLPFA